MAAPNNTATAKSRIAPEVVQRLDEAIRSAGGPSAIARQTGVPLRTVQNYLKGRGLKLETLIDVATAAGVSLDWLATGRGPMKPGEAPPPDPAPAPTPSGPKWLKAFGTIDVDAFTECQEAVLDQLRSLGVQNPNWRKVVQATLLLYDELLLSRARDKEKGQQK